ncbi:MAG: uridine kinase [Candidatus Latescibacterota bacterium]|nr:MAG: uridine kinase [Candidatus Latescibacterota bacterium]
MARPVVIGMAGGTGSGKTTLAHRIADALLEEDVVGINHDAYYLDRSDLPIEERAALNYDHPSAFDNALLLAHLDRMLDGEPISRPVYSFALHARMPDSVRVDPCPVVLLEGILVLENDELRRRMDIRIFVDCDEDERLIRRLRRDVHERGRSIPSVIEQYLNTVKPMHQQFVEPSKRYADLVVPRGGHNQVALEMILARIRDILSRVKRN